MKTETIFFVTFESGNKKHDRREYFDCDKTLREFHFWIEKMRDRLEADYKTDYVLTYMNMLQKIKV